MAKKTEGMTVPPVNRFVTIHPVVDLHVTV